MGFRKFSVLLGAAVAVAVLGAGSAKAATYNLLSGPQELSTLIGNIGTVGGLSFSFTSYTPPVGGPTAGQVLVSAFSAGGEVGIAFTPNNGSTGWTAPLGSSNDASILFSVSTTDG